MTNELIAFAASPIMRRWFLGRIFSKKKLRQIGERGDPVRFGTIDLALSRISEEKIQGSFAECGVYRGTLSKFMHDLAPERPLYLFDTFSGFDVRDGSDPSDARFRDTSVEGVKRHIGTLDNVHFRVGRFPETSVGLEAERFAFVMIDFDLYEPTMAALEFFYPRVERGGFVFVHDYTSDESNGACSRALDLFLRDKPERVITLPDAWGSAVFRKA